jgi:putative transposase
VGRIPRKHLPDGIWHVMTRGVDGCPIFRAGSDAKDFMVRFWTVTVQLEWTPYVLTLMTNHYHLVVEAPGAAISRGLHRLNGGYALAFNRRYGRRGHLFGDRFTARVVGDDRHLARVCGYVALNPVRAGLCVYADEWRWTWSRFELPEDEPL